MVKVQPIENNKKGLRKFVQFKNDLYRGNKYAVPALAMDEKATLSSSKNPASEFCDMQCFMAFDQDDKPVGRICAIINHKANQTWNNQVGRFGFFDFVEDIDVAVALLEAARLWLKKRGMQEMHGPLSFTDLDEEGMLIEGFEELSTMATLYNYPYYAQYMEQLGFVKAADWVEFSLKVPYPTPERIVKFAKIVEQKQNLHIVRCRNGAELIRKGWGTKIFELINSSYAKLYGFSSLTQRQIDNYVKAYIPLVRMELISLIADKDDNLVGFGISLPSLSKALQKARGKMLPFGWFFMLRALKRKKVDLIDLMLIAVHPDYQNKGLTAIIMNEIIRGMQAVGATMAESNPELEVNETMQNQWDAFDKRQHKRRRAYSKNIEDQIVKL